MYLSEDYISKDAVWVGCSWVTDDLIKFAAIDTDDGGLVIAKFCRV